MTPHGRAGSPRFSVVIPTYGRAHLLPRALASVTSQTTRDLEIIIVDDASPDSAVPIVASFDDRRVRTIRHAVNRGIAAARNTGIQAATAPLVAFLDDDDEYLPCFLEKTLEAYRAEGERIGWSWCGVIQVAADGTEEPAPIWKPQFSSLEDAYRGFLRYREVGTSSGFTARKELLVEAGLFDEDLRGGAEDTDLFIRLARIARFRVVEHHLLRFHDHPGLRLRRSTNAKARDYERIIERHREVLGEDPTLWSELHYKAAWLHFHGGDRTHGRRCMRLALERSPWMWKAWLSWLAFETLGQRAAVLHRSLSRAAARLRSRNPRAQKAPAP